MFRNFQLSIEIFENFSKEELFQILEIWNSKRNKC